MLEFSKRNDWDGNSACFSLNHSYDWILLNGFFKHMPHSLKSGYVNMFFFLFYVFLYLKYYRLSKTNSSIFYNSSYDFRWNTKHIVSTWRVIKLMRCWQKAKQLRNHFGRVPVSVHTRSMDLSSNCVNLHIVQHDVYYWILYCNFEI